MPSATQEPLAVASEKLLALQPASFLVPDKDMSQSIMDTVKTLFDKLKHAEPFSMSPLDSLIVDGFDGDQVWEQLQLQNIPMVEYLKSKTKEIIDRGDISEESDIEEEDNEDDLSGEEDLELPVSGDEDEDEDLDMSDEEDLDMDEEMEMGDDDGDQNVEDEEDGQDYEEEDLDDDDEQVSNSKKRRRSGQDEDNDESDEDMANDEDNEDNIRSGRVTELDDEFFSVEEMERFAERGENRDMNREFNKEDENDPWDLGLGYLGMDPDELEGSDDDDDEMNANEIRYEDFFLPPKKLSSAPKRGVRFNEKVDERKFLQDEPADHNLDQETSDKTDMNNNLENDDEGESYNRPTSSSNLFDIDNEPTSAESASRFEREQAKIASQISQLEAEAVAPKPWTLSGEVSAKARPSNSLLEQDLEIEHAGRPAPVVTEETTATLEDLIRSRISERLFDDVERKILPKEKVFDPNRRNIIDEQKSSKSLAEIYESEYHRQTSGGAEAISEREAALKKSHDEIDMLFKDLCQGLDALANWHFTPRTPGVEMEVVAAPTVQALNVEEVIPAVVSDAALVAPEEVYKADGTLKSQAELDSADKKKLRAKHKKAIKKQKMERAMEKKAEEKANGGNTGHESIKKGKERALEKLMTQKNVTIVADGKRGKGSVAEAAAMKGKGKKGKNIHANVIQKGGSLAKKPQDSGARAEFLRL